MGDFNVKLEEKNIYEYIEPKKLGETKELV